MDLATLVGLLAALGIIMASILLGGSASTFLNVPSLLVVIGGTIGAVLMQFSVGQFFGAMKVELKAFFNQSQAPEELIETTIDTANSARKGNQPEHQRYCISGGYATQQGIYLKMELVTYPEHHYIPVFARVVQCNQIEDDIASGYHLAVEFKGISEADEERIINHIFKLQAQEIKRQKLSKETEEAENSSDNYSTGEKATA